MRPIQMVDLQQQYAKIKDEVNAAIQEVLDTAAFINGKQVSEFAEHLSRYLNVKHVIPCANGTDALQIALMGLGLQPGDEVIVSNDLYGGTYRIFTKIFANYGINFHFISMQDAQNIRSVSTAPWLLTPALGVIISVLALNFLGDGLRDALDPKAAKD